jgi:uncharacterized protein YgiM (DUF1202 family)
MSSYLPAALGIAVLLIASTALAKERTALESASVKAATDCVTTAALKDPNITTLYREDRLDEVTDRIVLHSSVCDNPLRAMRLLHDRLYGEGTGRRFLRGDYLADLPRAVGERIKIVFNSQGKAPLPPSANGPLNAGDKLKVEGVGPNDVLNMREYATTNSPIIDVIPPNSEGIIYLGETQGEWILVRYANRAEGWVNRRFVVRLTTPGRRL